MKPGEWMITVDGNDDDFGLSGLIAMCSNNKAQVDEIVFARDHSGVDGHFLFLLLCPRPEGVTSHDISDVVRRHMRRDFEGNSSLLLSAR